MCDCPGVCEPPDDAAFRASRKTKLLRERRGSAVHRPNLVPQDPSGKASGDGEALGAARDGALIGHELAPER